MCRVVPVTPDERATARFELPGRAAALVAAAEGSWGGRLQVTLTYQSGPPLPRPRGSAPPAPAADGEIVLADVPALPAGSLLVVGPSPSAPDRHPALGGGAGGATGRRRRPGAGAHRRPAGARRRPRAGRPDVDARVVTGTLAVVDRDPARRRAEQVTGLGLHPDHPRYPARPLPPDHPRHPDRLLAAESRLVRTGGRLDGPDPAGRRHPASGARPYRRTAAADRFGEIDVRSFFDDDPVPDGDPLDERDDHRGVDRIGRVDELGLLCVPDLTWSGRAGHLDPQQADDAGRDRPPPAGGGRGGRAPPALRRAAGRAVPAVRRPTSAAGGPASTPATRRPTTPGSGCPVTARTGARSRCRPRRWPPA